MRASEAISIAIGAAEQWRESLYADLDHETDPEYQDELKASITQLGEALTTLNGQEYDKP